MSTSFEKQIDVINELITFNNDRVVGYELAAKETEDLSLKTIFQNFAVESRQHISVLSGEVTKLGGEPSKVTTTSGKVYRAWMEIKTALTGKNRKAIIESCEYGEDVILEAYDTALNAESSLPEDLIDIIIDQRNELQESHNTVKALRDTTLA